MTNTAVFEPDWVSPPGDTIDDALEEMGMSQVEFALRTGLSKKHVNELIRGKVSLTSDVAIKLEQVLGEPASFWLKRESLYQERLTRLSFLKEAESHAHWLKALPISEMIRLGWVQKYKNKGAQVLEVLRYFGTASVEAWEKAFLEASPAFRSSPAFEKKAGAVIAWMRQAELRVRGSKLKPFSETSLRRTLVAFRQLTLEPEPKIFIPKLQRLCAECGVAIAFVPSLRGCPVSGATWWATPEKAVVALSLRHKTNDHLWFSFFHEVGHILLHSKKAKFIDAEGFEGLDKDKELQADLFARNQLIPDGDGLRQLGTRNISKAAVLSFARLAGIAPGIVVGRLQHERILPCTHLNDLKVTYSWSS